ncbi:MAG TPA: hypothetical protein VFA04_18755 [Bryobacteraceae bacterium]|nr:hypothetical protein [Bryobacteraceae bacterium]
MSSSAQILANQKNATSSTGPRTDAGKATSSQNAVSHGLTGSFRVLPHENQADFDACLARYRQEFEPTTEHERFLVELITQSRWELQRTNRLIAAVLERMASAPDTGAASPDAAIAAALIGRTADAFTTLKRYAAAAERTYLRCSRELTQNAARRAKVAAVVAEAKLWAGFTPEPNEPSSLAPEPKKTRKPTPGVPFTDEDPLSWRL